MVDEIVIKGPPLGWRVVVRAWRFSGLGSAPYQLQSGLSETGAEPSVLYGQEDSEEASKSW